MKTEKEWGESSRLVALTLASSVLIINKRPSSKSTSRSKRKDQIKVEIKPSIRDLSIKSNSKYINRSCSSRNLTSVNPQGQHEVTSKLEKSFKKIISKYPNKQAEKVKELK